MINKKIVNEFANIIGNIEIAMQLDSLKSTKNKYEIILSELLMWIKSYYMNKNLDIITYERSLKIHSSLEEIKGDILPNKEIGIESLLTDNILIRYEVIIKMINNERKKNNE